MSLCSSSVPVYPSFGTSRPHDTARDIRGPAQSAGATPRRLIRRGRPTPTAAAVQRTEAGARRPGLPAPTTSAQTTPPLYPSAYHTPPQGSRSSRSGKRAKWGEAKRVQDGRVPAAAVDQGPGEPTGRWLGVRLPMVCRKEAGSRAITVVSLPPWSRSGSIFLGGGVTPTHTDPPTSLLSTIPLN